jgi:hypothetical protein
MNPANLGYFKKFVDAEFYQVLIHYKIHNLTLISALLPSVHLYRFSNAC